MNHEIQEGKIIYMVFVSCLKEDVQCNNPMKTCKNCVPDNFEAHISRVVYTAEKRPLLGIKYFFRTRGRRSKESGSCKRFRGSQRCWTCQMTLKPKFKTCPYKLAIEENKK